MTQQDEFDLKESLEQCSKAAAKGYEIAADQAKKLNDILLRAEYRIHKTARDFQISPVYDAETLGLLEQQFMNIHASYKEMSVVYKEDIENHRKRLSKFSITLFGRTLAGKSTLMEILTHGNGDSIGKGAQRTTQDVRRYEWNSLEITDVPGIGAFEGQEDESTAFEAAKSADLILFLLTDDAPQAVEAECFSRIIDLGKPVLCIMNVKSAIDENEDIELTLMDINDSFDMDRLETIRNEFVSYGERFGQEWKNIPFVYTHLQAAFISQNAKDRGLSVELYNASRISCLKRRIIEQVQNKGEFYRIKTFIDAVAVPTLAAEDTLLKQSILFGTQGRTILAKHQNLEDWKGKFYRDCKSRIESRITSFRSLLYSEIANFAEEHYNDKNADKEWNRLIQKRGIQDRCQALLESFEDQVNDKIKEIAREITNELRLDATLIDDKALRMHKMINVERYWNRGTQSLSAGLSLGAGIASFVGEEIAGTLAATLGAAAIGVYAVGVIGSVVLKGSDKKESKARQQLEDNLKKNIDRTCQILGTELMKKFDQLVEVRINKLLKEMDRMHSVLFELSDTQKDLAWKLNDRLLELNKQIVTEAIRIIGARGLEWWISEVARIPGNSVLLQLNEGKVIPEEKKAQLQDLMSELIGSVYFDNDKREFLLKILGENIDRSEISVEEEKGIAHIPLADASADLINKAKMAQQLSQLVIIQ